MVKVQVSFVCDLCGVEPKPRYEGPARMPEGYVIKRSDAGRIMDLVPVDGLVASQGERVICRDCVLDILQVGEHAT